LHHSHHFITFELPCPGFGLKRKSVRAEFQASEVWLGFHKVNASHQGENMCAWKIPGKEKPEQHDPFEDQRDDDVVLMPVDQRPPMAKVEDFMREVKPVKVVKTEAQKTEARKREERLRALSRNGTVIPPPDER
jgi:hypothetical protein